VLASLLLLAPGVLGAGDDGRISCFVMGERVDPGGNPFTTLFMQDPAFTYSLYPLNPDLNYPDKVKLDRVYYPRTGKVLVDNFDAMIIRDARIQHFTPTQYRDMDYAFREAGLSCVTIHGPSWEHVWIGVATLYELSPVDDFVIRYYRPWRVVFRREREPIFTPFADLGMEKVVGEAYGTMAAKPGATVWADMDPQEVPWLVSWRPGGGDPGIQWVFADKFDATWWGLGYGARDTNPYSIDLATNLLFYSVDRPLISDIQARRYARGLLHNFKAQKLLILSMMEWAENFGANTRTISVQLPRLDGEAQGGIDSYVEQDYPTAIAAMESLTESVGELTKEALELKDQAMFWVYVSEWLVVTSASILSGVVLWSLMIRRRMYKGVESTRLVQYL
jgi:hypothetical protein